MKLKAFIALVVMAIIMTLLTSVVRAEEPEDDFQYLHDHDRICFAQSYDDPSGYVVVVDTFRITFDNVINPGTTSLTLMNCIPLACPEGMVLLSGNVCAGEETSPFAHIPVLTDEEYQEQTAVGEPPVPAQIWMNGTMYFGGQL